MWEPYQIIPLAFFDILRVPALCCSVTVPEDFSEGVHICTYVHLQAVIANCFLNLYSRTWNCSWHQREALLRCSWLRTRDANRRVQQFAREELRTSRRSGEFLHQTMVRQAWWPQWPSTTASAFCRSSLLATRGSVALKLSSSLLSWEWNPLEFTKPATTPSWSAMSTFVRTCTPTPSSAVVQPCSLVSFYLAATCVFKVGTYLRGPRVITQHLNGRKLCGARNVIAIY